MLSHHARCGRSQAGGRRAAISGLHLTGAVRFLAADLISRGCAAKPARKKSFPVRVSKNALEKRVFPTPFRAHCPEKIFFVPGFPRPVLKKIFPDRVLPDTIEKRLFSTASGRKCPEIFPGRAGLARPALPNRPDDRVREEPFLDWIPEALSGESAPANCSLRKGGAPYH